MLDLANFVIGEQIAGIELGTVEIVREIAVIAYQLVALATRFAAGFAYSHCLAAP